MMMMDKMKMLILRKMEERNMKGRREERRNMTNMMIKRKLQLNQRR